MRFYPIIWVIGPSRSCKTAMARGLSQKGPAPTNYPVFSTGDYYRRRYGRPDTFNARFIFNISSFTTSHLVYNKAAHQSDMIDFLHKNQSPVIIEGERNPFVFGRFYRPGKDLVFFMNRQNIEKYDTAIEPGVQNIYQNLKWGVKAGFIPLKSVISFKFGDGRVQAEHLPAPGENLIDEVFYDQPEFPRHEGDLYPWMGTLVALAQDKVLETPQFNKLSLSNPYATPEV